MFICFARVIPCLVKEFVNPTMVPFVLPNVLQSQKNCTKEEFSQLILPYLKPVMKMTDPIQILLIFMQKMELLLKLCPCEEVKSDVLPMLYRALETDAQQIQELCLSVLPTYASLIEYPAMKNALLPRIKRLCISTSFISVRVNCLVCVGKLLEHLDKWLVLDEVLPFLPQIPSREPAVLMGILGIYKLVLTHKKMTMTKEVMATKVIPFLMPLSIENALTLNQFNAIIAVIKEMVNRVEGEHRVKLEQLNSIQNEQQNMDSNMASQLTSAPPTRSEFEEILGMQPSPPRPTMSVNSDISSLAQSKPLSLQDKQGLVKEQDAVRRLQQEPVLNPTQVLPKGPPPVKDLTMSLMENNLKQISLGGLGPPVAPVAAPVAPVAAWTAQAWRPPVQPQAWQSAPVTFPGPQFQLSTNKVPMNTMVSQNTFQSSMMNGMKPSQPTKQLSNTEINDFLS
ncbi:LOW QUALITY PROTEIN: SCY1-like protein 2 [Homalodisca vitripennis]|uniref:LOW QUALITY PROTEIN: SCY1-like protein 2 n=1 Tax=Homalodisca vitripennis TaxID=197043 RepID=UPI001EEA448A|nr:LOW QUALITY PROTEIN: SCY1-like protein 2 [Homalodisca vitripennis]